MTTPRDLVPVTVVGVGSNLLVRDGGVPGVVLRLGRGFVEIEADGGDFRLEPHDWRYYTDRLRRERYALDDSEIRAYFSLENVLQGAFTVANRLYGVTFIERHDLPVYHPDVRIWEVIDAEPDVQDSEDPIDIDTVGGFQTAEYVIQNGMEKFRV